MKKMLLILLSVLLVFSSCWCAFSVSAEFESVSETPPEVGNPNLASGWQIYSNSASQTESLPLSECTPCDPANPPNVTDNTAQVGDYTGSSLKFDALNQWAVANFAVQKNSDYVISFDYYSNTQGSNAISSACVLKSGGKLGSNSEDNLAFVNDSATLTTIAGQWQQMSLEFNSADNSYVALAFVAGVDIIYVKNVNLIEVYADINDAEAWTVYKNGSGTTKLSERDPYVNNANNNVTNDTTTVMEGIEKSLKIKATLRNAVTTLNVEKNKNYKLSFYYNSPTLNSNGTTILNEVQVLKSGGATGTASEDNLSIITNKTAFTGPASNKVENEQRTLTTQKDTWILFEIKFASGENEKVDLSIVSVVANVYLSSITLVEDTPPSQPDNSAANDAAAWTVYKNGSGTTKLSERDPYPVDNKNNNITNDTTTVMEGIEKSLKIKATLRNAVTTLNVEKNKNYKLSFYYNSPTLNSNGTTILNEVQVLKSGGATGAASEDNLSIITNKTAFTGPASNKVENEQRTLTTQKDTWILFEIKFASGENEKVDLSIVSVVANVYLSSITLVEDTTSTPENPYGTPVAEHIIDFEDSSKQYVTFQEDRMEVVTAKNDKDEDSKMLHVKGGTYDGLVTNLDQAKTQNTDTHPVYTIPLDPTKGYTVSWKMKVNEPTVAMDWFKFYAYCNKQLIGSKEMRPFRVADYGKWVTYSFDFSAAEGQNRFSFFFNAGKNTPEFWIDDITVKEKPLVDPGTGTVNDASAWKIFPNSVTVGGVKNSNYVLADHLDYYSKNWKVEDSIDKVKEGTNKSLKFTAQAQRGVTNLKVEKNKDYTLKFYYYCDVISSSGYILSQVQVLKKYGQIATKSEDNLSIVTGTTSFTGPASNPVKNIDRTSTNMKGMWIEFATGFNSGDNEEVSFALMFGSGCLEVYVSDITLTEGKYTPTGPDMYYGETEPVKIIDFEDPTREYITTQSERFKIVTVKNDKGEDTTALHGKKGTYGTTTNLDQANAKKSDHPVYTLPIKPNKVYELSLKIKIDATDITPDWFSYGFYVDGSFTSLKNVLSSGFENNVWYTFKTYFVPPADATGGVTFYFDAGKVTPDFWIDDITLTETEHERFAGHQRGADSWTVNFDDFFVGLTQGDRMSVEVGPEREDGSTSKALHIYQGDYSSETLLNYSAAINLKDPYFTFPVEENELYRWSAWFFVPKGSISYFAFWYNYNKENTSANIFRVNTKITDRGVWVKGEATFTTAPGQTMCSTLFNAGKIHPEIWIDDIKLEKLPAGTSSSTEYNYCENLYDLTDDISNAADLNNLKSGVYKLPVNTMKEYTFGATLTNGKAGDNIQLSFDSKTPMPQNGDAPASSITFSSGKREGIVFVSDKSGYVYLIVNNASGTLKAEDIQLFATKSRSTNREMGRIDNPNITLVEKPSIEELKTK